MRNSEGIIFDIDHFAVHDGQGIRSAVYLKGCPLRCVWCHSPQSQEPEPQLLHIKEKCRGCRECHKADCMYDAIVMCGKKISVHDLVNEILPHKPFYDNSGGGVTLSGGEVLSQPEFSLSLLKSLKEKGIHTIVETSGMGSLQTLLDMSDFTDEFYYDIKSFNSKNHIKHTGVDNKTILSNLISLTKLRNGKGITIRTPLIPGYNDSESEITDIYQLAVENGISEIHLLKYNTLASAKYEWLSREYIPGDLKPHDDAYINNLIAKAHSSLKVKTL